MSVESHTRITGADAERNASELGEQRGELEQARSHAGGEHYESQAGSPGGLSAHPDARPAKPGRT